MRTEAQKAADKRYAEKIRKEKKYIPFVVNLSKEEHAYFEKVLNEHDMGKAAFLRWALQQLEQTK